MRPIRRSSDSKSRKVTPPSPAYMTNEQFGMTPTYLAELRSNRIARPGGARPVPSSSRPAPGRTLTSRASTGRFSPDADSLAGSVAGSLAGSLAGSHAGADHASTHHEPSIAAGSIASRYSSVSGRSRDYYPASSTTSVPLKPSDVVPTATYIERGQRWMEKEEATSLREAMEELDFREKAKDVAKEATSENPDDETRIYNAALNEAAELVWQHQHGEIAPRPNGPYRYRPHLRENSYALARTASVGNHGAGLRSVSGSSTESDDGSRRDRSAVVGGDRANRKSRSYGSIGRAAGRGSIKRNISGEIDRPFSGDQIWEEPESSQPKGKGVSISGHASPQKLSNRPPNPFSRVRFEPLHEETTPTKLLNKVDIHRNPPTRSRNPEYKTNPDTPPRMDDKVEKKNGMEVRGQDIRDATSMRLKDRSPKLPEPTAVSDSPGRPIVSFDANWKAPDESTDASSDRSTTTPVHCSSGSQSQSSLSSQSRTSSICNHNSNPNSGPSCNSSQKPSLQSFAKRMEVPSIVVAEEGSSRPRAPPGANVPSIAIAGPSDDKPRRRDLPSINVPPGVPTIAVNDASGHVDIPVIVTPDDRPSTNGRSRDPRPLPSPKSGASRGNIPRPRGHWSPAPGVRSRTPTSCHECGFPIVGRFVALAGGSERFHPHCFSCFSCGTSLEAMEISPEPDNVRADRLDRIRRRAAGEILSEEPGMTMAEDGDERLRFYCHLDWHEQFAPRCKHCKTPILGEHIVALGEHWHYGHFFCAECGDPFEHGMTHIEKDGYAWCVNCQTKRTERRAPKCKMCKTAVIGQYIQALGGEWHEHCFRCADCHGGFDDGQVFPVERPKGMVVLCTPCRAMELKA